MRQGKLPVCPTIFEEAHMQDTRRFANLRRALKLRATTCRFLIVTLIFTLLIPLADCKVKKTVRLDPSVAPEPGKEKIVGVTTSDGQDVRFDSGGATVRGDTLQASVNGAPYQITLDRVQRYWIERTETSKARTIGLIAGVTVGVFVAGVAIALATKQSCPFIYSWNGSEYVFDAEPYGGAVTRGLERDDYSELENLSAENGLYRLMVTNEVPETQYTNLMELQVVDHPAATRVVADEWGGFHVLAAPQRLTSARDNQGRDMLPWLMTTDRVIWEAPPVLDANGGVRQEIVMTFPKPKGATRARLVANVATGLWGSNMIKEMLMLRGRDLESWYASMDSDRTQSAELFAWILREEIFALKLEVEESDGWKHRGTLPGGGPFIAEDRVVVMDVSRATGDQLRVRIRPPVGFWALNSFAVDYGSDQTPVVENLRPIKAWDDGDRDLLADLLKTDDAYYAMPKVGDRAWVNFPAPAPRPGMDRTVFLHSRGYYRLHLTGSGNPDTATLGQIGSVPDAAARFAIKRYNEWRVAQASK
jgi:hypothetical protein